MDVVFLKEIKIKETKRLEGIVRIQGSKNTILPIMAATLLVSGVVVIYNCPRIEDVNVMCQLLKCLHIETELVDDRIIIDTTKAQYEILPSSLTRKLRSSVLLLGPMLARWNKAEMGLPGGCEIGIRPIDIHLEGFSKMNVDINCNQDFLCCSTTYLQGGRYTLRFPSVGATENLVMAAARSKGRTILRGVAKEPEIIELCNYLVSLGVLIEGIGTDVLIIKGSSQLQACDYCNRYDRIVAGTYLLMAAMIPSNIKLTGIDDIYYLKNIIVVASKLGVNVVKKNQYLCIQSYGKVIPGDFETGIFPKFPTDLQPILITVLLKAQGSSSVNETIFENRLAIVNELKKLNANIEVYHQKAIITGGVPLLGNKLEAKDLRQGAAVVLAGLIAKGTTIITSISYIERGYEDIVRDLKLLGADISYQ